MFMAKWTIPPTKIQKFPLGQLRVLGKKTAVAVEKMAGWTEKDPVKHFCTKSGIQRNTLQSGAPKR